MRDISQWHGALSGTLKQHWPGQGAPFRPSVLCDIELGLYLLELLLPGARAQALWVLLSGHPFPLAQADQWSEAQRRALDIARHLLPYYRSPFPWRRALEQYADLEPRLCGYMLDTESGLFSRRDVSVAARRWQVYEEALQTPPRHRRYDLRWAGPGSYTFEEGRQRGSVSIPGDLPLPPPPAGHNLTPRALRRPLHVSLEELRATARWMDAQLERSGTPGGWQARIERVRLDMLNPEGSALVDTQVLTLDGMCHMVGMVSSGKSTLMDVLAVHAARQGQRVTLVVGDVIAVLNRAGLFTALGLSAAPILGASNRERHLGRLHRAQTAVQPRAPLDFQHPGFQWLSSSCPLDALRAAARSLPLNQRPCAGLIPVTDEADEPKPRYACPLYSSCAFHQAQRDLVEARIWVATPASLIYTRVAPQLNREHMRFTELVFRRSDLLIIDEADQVQIQLDSIFSPAQNLVSRSSDAWLNQLSEQVARQINREGRGQLADERVAQWCQAHDLVQIAASRVYALLLQSQPLHEAIARDYFTAWTLLERLARQLSGFTQQAGDQKSDYEQLMRHFNACIDDPLGEYRQHSLAALVRQSVTSTNAEGLRADLAAWVVKHCKAADGRQEQIDEWAKWLELALVVAVLSNRLDLIIRDWRYVEGPLQLEGAGSILFHRPPEDYSAEIPAAPMGNVLAFQYLRNDDPLGPGDLRFFRCMGVGRWLLLNAHQLFQLDRLAGPHVLLLSATSWAGTAPGFSLQVPVSGILRAPRHELDAIEQSRFSFEPFYDRDSRPIRVSGLRGHARLHALQSLLALLARRPGLGGKSPLERMRDSLPAGRQRILLLVGSYDEARQAHTFLEQTRPDWDGQVLHLIADDDLLESQWGQASQSLQRGMVYRFAQTDAWILIAPLLAVERGHNILNDQNEAALGAAYFLIRPHPRPDDISFAITSINRWAIERTASRAHFLRSFQVDLSNPEAVGKSFRDAAYKEWRRLLHLPMRYSTLGEHDHEAVTWNQLVTIWQVIGRLVRGGVPARVIFCDAAFAPIAFQQEGGSGQPQTSLLIGMHQLLQRYIDGPPTRTVSPTDQVLARALYGPLYQALSQMRGLLHV